jgi:hypothetical protein
MNAQPCRHDQLGAALILPNIRRCPIGADFAFNLPDLRARLFVECEQKRFFVVVIDEVEAIFIQHR